MSVAYAVVLVSDEMMHHSARQAVQEAQAAADKRFEEIAIAARLTSVLRNPEPRVMTYQELRLAYPYANLDGLTGLYFTADIT